MYKKIISFILLFTLIGIISIKISSFPVKADAAGNTFTVQKVAAPTTISPNSILTYSITIRNTGNVNLAPQSLEDTLPEGFTFVGNAKLTTVQGQQVEFPPTQTQGNKITWVFDGDRLQSIPPNQNIVITYQVRTGSETGAYTNRACLISPENVCASATVNVITSPNASLNDDVIIALLIILPGVILIITLYNNKSFEKKILRI